jgi:2-oxoisovalerate dehydrogenase E1 component beta subunit
MATAHDHDRGAALAMDVMMGATDNVVVFGEDVGYFGGVFRCTEGLQAEVRQVALLRRADLRVGHRRRRHRHGRLRPAPGASRSSSPTTSTRPTTRSSARRRGCATARQRRLHRADRDHPHADRRRHLRRADAQPEPGGAVHPCLRPASTVMPSNPYDAKGLLIAAIEDDDPVIFLEPKRLYNGPFDGHHDRPVVPWSQAPHGRGPEGHYSVPLGKAAVRPGTPGHGAGLRHHGLGREAAARRPASTPRSSTCAASAARPRHRWWPRSRRPGAASSCTRRR